MLSEMVAKNLLRKIPSVSVKDFIADYDNLATIYENVAMEEALKKPKPQAEDAPPPPPKPQLPEPSLAQVKQLVVERCVLPLGCDKVYSLSPKSVLLYGPHGCGKTMLAYGIANDTNALFFDLSPANIAGKFAESEAATKYMVQCVSLLAAHFDVPAVVYVDEAEKVFGKSAKAKKGKKGKKKKGDKPGTPAGAEKTDRITKYVLEMLGKEVPCAAINPETKALVEVKRVPRVLVVGNTSNVEGAEAGLAENFGLHLYCSLPLYQTRYKLWKETIAKYDIELEHPLQHQVFAYVTHGFSSGGILRTIRRVLNPKRLERLDYYPLKDDEFIAELSRLTEHYMYQQNLDAFKAFNDLVPAFPKLPTPPDPEGGKKGKKGGKGGKKGKK
nr:IQ and AAA domain-containing protein 1 [Seculamonas ecuadoriensis]